ncbi:hypothetical protein OSB04_028212 [Centaurea solstitialis]|uniref:Uncharacterized protein n=1 Tax=Centaurea solstitialis TaxID=347529 RepID=A0AA38SS75_9ASTR|nr:hypothetical protein OSB04_028212 [Centaurea solstitialis]
MAVAKVPTVTVAARVPTAMAWFRRVVSGGSGRYQRAEATLADFDEQRRQIWKSGSAAAVRRRQQKVQRQFSSSWISGGFPTIFLARVSNEETKYGYKEPWSQSKTKHPKKQIWRLEKLGNTKPILNRKKSKKPSLNTRNLELKVWDYGQVDMLIKSTPKVWTDYGQVDMLIRSAPMDIRGILGTQPSNAPLTPIMHLTRDRERYRMFVGKLNYLTMTLPAIAYSVSMVGSVKRNSMLPGIVYSNHGHGHVQCFLDAEWQMDRRSNSGYCLSFVGGNFCLMEKQEGKCSLKIQPEVISPGYHQQTYGVSTKHLFMLHLIVYFMNILRTLKSVGIRRYLLGTILQLSVNKNHKSHLPPRKDFISRKWLATSSDAATDSPCFRLQGLRGCIEVEDGRFSSTTVVPGTKQLISALRKCMLKWLTPGPCTIPVPLCKGTSDACWDSFIESNCGIMADSAGTINPHIPNNAAAQIERSKLDLPPPFGPVKRNIEFISIVLWTALPSAASNQYGDRPNIQHKNDTHMALVVSDKTSCKQDDDIAYQKKNDKRNHLEVASWRISSIGECSVMTKVNNMMLQVSHVSQMPFDKN